MRDLLVVLIVAGSLPFIIMRPWYGVLVLAWLGYMNPHRLAYGYSYDFGFVALVAGATLVGAVFSRDLTRPALNPLTLALFLFGAWTGVTTMHALHPAETSAMWIRWMSRMIWTWVALRSPRLTRTSVSVLPFVSRSAASWSPWATNPSSTAIFPNRLSSCTTELYRPQGTEGTLIHRLFIMGSGEPGPRTQDQEWYRPGTSFTHQTGDIVNTSF